ncbi:hypothetical protein QEN19_001728 [Hanseniaspora menglaensis]
MSNVKEIPLLLESFKPSLQFFKKSERVVIYGKNSNKILSSLHQASLSKQSENLKVNYLQFNKNLNNLNTSLFLSARFEHFKEEFDVTLKDFLLQMEASKKVQYSLNGKNDSQSKTTFYKKLIEKLHLKDLLSKDLMLLSNGQMRRSRLAQLLLKCISEQTEIPALHNINLIDDYVLGLDCNSRNWINESLSYFHETTSNNTTVVSLRPQDEVPKWCQRLIINDKNMNIVYDGSLNLKIIECYKKIWHLENEINKKEFKEYDVGPGTVNGLPVYGKDLIKPHKWYDPLHQHDFVRKEFANSDVNPHISFKNVAVKYGSMDNPIFSNFNWDIPKASKWILKGNNGSGKSTITALLTLDHPQSWCNHISFHGKPVEVGKTSYSQHNAHISSSSPELHNLCLSKKKTVKEVLLSGLNFDSNNNFTVSKNISENMVNLYKNHLAYWNLSEVENAEFNSLQLNDQKLVLFARALIKLPELLILDEAFSGMSLETIDKCHFWLDHYWCGTLVLVGHLEEELISNCKILKL